jgi:hypothetical protein
VSDALEAVQTELSALMVPWPDDYVEGLSPPAALLLLRQLAMATLTVVTGASASLEEDPDGPAGAVAEVLNGASMAVVGATHALVALGVLPPEAEQALEEGTAP